MFDWLKHYIGLTSCHGCIYRRFGGLCCGYKGKSKTRAWEKLGCWCYTWDKKWFGY